MALTRSNKGKPKSNSNGIAKTSAQGPAQRNQARKTKDQAERKAVNTKDPVEKKTGEPVPKSAAKRKTRAKGKVVVIQPAQCKDGENFAATRIVLQRRVVAELRRSKRFEAPEKKRDYREMHNPKATEEKTGQQRSSVVEVACEDEEPQIASGEEAPRAGVEQAQGGETGQAAAVVPIPRRELEVSEDMDWDALVALTDQIEQERMNGKVMARVIKLSQEMAVDKRKTRGMLQVLQKKLEDLEKRYVVAE